MKSLHLIKKQVLILLVFAILMSIFAIIHGIFFDLDFNEVKRLTIEGLFITLIIIFPALLFLEWIFDINNKKKFEEVESRLNKIEKRLKRS